MDWEAEQGITWRARRAANMATEWRDEEEGDGDEEGKKKRDQVDREAK